MVHDQAPCDCRMLNPAFDGAGHNLSFKTLWRPFERFSSLNDDIKVNDAEELGFEMSNAAGFLRNEQKGLTDPHDHCSWKESPVAANQLC